MSTAELVRASLAGSPIRSFIATSKVPGPRHAVECELSRLIAEGEVVRVRKGLYWKGPRTRVGMPLPRPTEVALEVGGIGSGPAEISAAHLLGLTTQVPAVEVIAVPGRIPSPVPGARFVSRSIERRILGLRPIEVALLEVLRAGPGAVEASPVELAKVAGRLAAAGEIRPEVLGEQVRHERHLATRQRWAQLNLSDTVAS